MEAPRVRPAMSYTVRLAGTCERGLAGGSVGGSL